MFRRRPLLQMNSGRSLIVTSPGWAGSDGAATGFGKRDPSRNRRKGRPATIEVDCRRQRRVSRGKAFFRPPEDEVNRRMDLTIGAALAGAALGRAS
jgi:hypothetical protein